MFGLFKKPIRAILLEDYIEYDESLVKGLEFIICGRGKGCYLQRKPKEDAEIEEDNYNCIPKSIVKLLEKIDE